MAKKAKALFSGLLAAAMAFIAAVPVSAAPSDDLLDGNGIDFVAWSNEENVGNAFDGDNDTYWSPEDGQAAKLEIRFPETKTISRIVIDFDALGQTEGDLDVMIRASVYIDGTYNAGERQDIRALRTEFTEEEKESGQIEILLEPEQGTVLMLVFANKPVTIEDLCAQLGLTEPEITQLKSAVLALLAELEENPDASAAVPALIQSLRENRGLLDSLTTLLALIEADAEAGPALDSLLENLSAETPDADALNAALETLTAFLEENEAAAAAMAPLTAFLNDNSESLGALLSFGLTSENFANVLKLAQPLLAAVGEDPTVLSKFINDRLNGFYTEDRPPVVKINNISVYDDPNVELPAEPNYLPGMNKDDLADVLADARERVAATEDLYYPSSVGLFNLVTWLADAAIVNPYVEPTDLVLLALAMEMAEDFILEERPPALDIEEANNLALLEGTQYVHSTESSGNTADKAFDGDMSTRWGSGKWDSDGYVQVKFPTAVAFDTVKINWENNTTMQYEIQISDDGSKWTSIHQGTMTTIMDGTLVDLGQQYTAQYVRIAIPGDCEWAGIYEAGIYNYEGGGLKATLDAAVQAAKAEYTDAVLADYTQATVDAYKAALRNAEDAIADTEISQNDVLRQLRELEDAIGDLQKANPTDPDPTDPDPTDPDPTDPDPTDPDPATPSVPGTGVSAIWGGVLLLAVLAGIGILASRKRQIS